MTSQTRREARADLARRVALDLRLDGERPQVPTVARYVQHIAHSASIHAPAAAQLTYDASDRTFVQFVKAVRRELGVTVREAYR